MSSFDLAGGHIENGKQGRGAMAFVSVIKASESFAVGKPQPALGTPQCLDVGLFIQSLCLAATDRGLGTAVLAAAINYAEVVREVLGIPEDKRIIMGVAMGWPNPDSPVNRFQRQRPALGEIARWAG